MAVDLEGDESYHQTDWPTGLTFSLMSVNDDSNDDLTAASNSAMVVLHDRLITDASVSKNLVNNSSVLMDHNDQNSSSLLTCPDATLISCKPNSTSTYSITIDSRGEVEISEEPKSNKGNRLTD